MGVVQKTNTGKRVYDKRQACLFCGETFSKLSSHLENKHSDEKEVAEVLAKKKGEPRKLGWMKLRNLGNFHHNIKVLEEGRGNLIVDRRPKKNEDSSNFMPCPSCLGFFKSTELWKHRKSCLFAHTCKTNNYQSSDSDEQKKICMIKKESMHLLQGAMEPRVDKEFIHLLSTMKSDKITETVKHDRGLMHLGTTKLKKVGLSRSANVRQKTQGIVAPSSDPKRKS